MIRYSYYYNFNLDLHVVMVSKDNSDGTVSIRPACAYYSEKSAKAYINTCNDRITNNIRTPNRSNPPVRYFKVPKWWEEKFPNWNHMTKVA